MKYLFLFFVILFLGFVITHLLGIDVVAIAKTYMNQVSK